MELHSRLVFFVLNADAILKIKAEAKSVRLLLLR